MLNEQLQKQIEQEAEHYANVHIGEKAKFIGHHDSRRWDDAKEDWEAGATQYAELWQRSETSVKERGAIISTLNNSLTNTEAALREAEQRADRYEKALNAILNTNHDNYEKVILKVKCIATEALPKTSTDEHT